MAVNYYRVEEKKKKKLFVGFPFVSSARNEKSFIPFFFCLLILLPSFTIFFSPPPSRSHSANTGGGRFFFFLCKKGYSVLSPPSHTRAPQRFADVIGHLPAMRKGGILYCLAKKVSPLKYLQ